MNRANLKRRILTGMFGGSLLLFSALHEVSYLAVFVIIIFLSSREYYKILSNNNVYKILICSRAFENEIKSQLRQMKIRQNKIIVA